MNILHVYPKIPEETFWSLKKAVAFVGKKAALPPLPLLTVSGILRELRPEWNQRLIDLNIEKLPEEDLEWADLVFVSAMIIQEESVHELIPRFKKHENLKIVAGGPLFTSQETETEGVDYFVLGEAEVTLPLFLDDLEAGKAKHRYETDVKPDLAKTPPPNWDLLKAKFKHYSGMSVQYSRGCPHKCEFCDIRVMFGQTPRVKDNAQFIRELELLFDAGYTGSVFIVDDNFIGNKTRVKSLLPPLTDWLKQRKYPFKFMTEASVNLATDEALMNGMSDANFYKVFLGLETPSLEALTECNKGQNVKFDLVEAVHKIQAHGMMVMSGHIVGFDSDDESIFARQIEFIQKTGVAIAMVGLLSVLPKTDLEKRLKSAKRILSKTTGENSNNLTYIPKMDKDVLINGYYQLLSTIYAPKEYYKRIDVFIQQYKPTVRRKFGIDVVGELGALMRGTLKLGFSWHGYYYWRLLAKTLLTKPKAFSEAVELAICGVHFRSVTKRIVSG
ncbi:MAG: B12-binding domain-containing radical SAM protein [Thermoleophilia bacterium]